MFGNITEHLAWDVIVPVILSIVGFLTSFTVGTKTRWKHDNPAGGKTSMNINLSTNQRTTVIIRGGSTHPAQSEWATFLAAIAGFALFLRLPWLFVGLATLAFLLAFYACGTLWSTNRAGTCLFPQNYVRFSCVVALVASTVCLTIALILRTAAWEASQVLSTEGLKLAVALFLAVVASLGALILVAQIGAANLGAQSTFTHTDSAVRRHVGKAIIWFGRPVVASRVWTTMLAVLVLLLVSTAGCVLAVRFLDVS